MKLLAHIAVSISILLTLSACQKERITIIREGGPSSQQPAQTFPDLEVGGIDGGGGNAVAGRPIESFIVDPIEKYDARQILMGKIKNLYRTSPRVATDLLHIIIHRKWLHLPLSLKKIKTETLGAFVGDSELAQVALQSTGEIWISSPEFDRLSTEDQSQIILHELVMGVRLMSFQTPRDQCLAQAVEHLLISSEGHAQYHRARKNCFKGHSQFVDSFKNPLKRGTAIGPLDIYLTKVDYINVRGITHEIWTGDAHVDESFTDRVQQDLKRDYN